MRIITLCLLLLCATVCQAQTPSASNTGLFAAARALDIKRAESALQSGANINARDKGGTTPLMLTISAGSEDAEQNARRIAMIQLLLRYNADPNLASLELNQGYSWTPLMSADNNAPVLQLLLNTGADANQRGSNGETVFTQLLQWQRPKRAPVEVLLKGGANPNAGDGYGNTPLMLAAGKELGLYRDELTFAQLADLFIANGANINAQNDEGQTALMSAAKAQQTSNTRALLERGAEVDARDKQGRTALMHAFDIHSYGTPSSGGTVIQVWPAQANVRLLLERGANVNARDKTGASTLVRVAQLNPRSYVRKGEIAPKYIEQCNVQIAALARLLLAKSAGISLRTGNGNTALKWAKVRGNQPLIQLLENAGAK